MTDATTQPAYEAVIAAPEDEGCTICPLTGTYCQGEHAHLCDDYGCARKVGMSPYSDEERMEWEQ